METFILKTFCILVNLYSAAAGTGKRFAPKVFLGESDDEDFVTFGCLCNPFGLLCQPQLRVRLKTGFSFLPIPFSPLDFPHSATKLEKGRSTGPYFTYFSPGGLCAPCVYFYFISDLPWQSKYWKHSCESCSWICGFLSYLSPPHYGFCYSCS